LWVFCVISESHVGAEQFHSIFDFYQDISVVICSPESRPAAFPESDSSKIPAAFRHDELATDPRRVRFPPKIEAPGRGGVAPSPRPGWSAQPFQETRGELSGLIEVCDPTAQERLVEIDLDSDEVESGLALGLTRDGRAEVPQLDSPMPCCRTFCQIEWVYFFVDWSYTLATWVLKVGTLGLATPVVAAVDALLDGLF